jgi:hypothetical protein
MKSDVLELIVYLFEHYMGDDGDTLPDEEGLRDELPAVPRAERHPQPGQPRTGDRPADGVGE